MGTNGAPDADPPAAVARAIDRREKREIRHRWRVAAVLAAAVFVADQITKSIIRGTMVLGEDIPVIPEVFAITRVRNEGIAFSLFPGRQGLIATLTIVALGVIALALMRLVGRNTWIAAGAGLLFGGSLGNLVDRLLHGGVTDFLDLTRWPAFNIADIGITCGAALVVFGLLRDGDRDPET